MSVLIAPQERCTSEVPYHSDLAPGRRFVFVGRQVYPQSALYVVGRRVDDGASLMIGAPKKTLEVEIRSEQGCVQGASPATVYHPRGVSYAYTRVEGAGMILELEKA